MEHSCEAPVLIGGKNQP